MEAEVAGLKKRIFELEKKFGVITYISISDAINKISEFWKIHRNSWEEYITKRPTLHVLKVPDDHIQATSINAANIPTHPITGRLLFLLHNLPQINKNGETCNGGFISDIQSFEEKAMKMPWFISLGTSGSGKTRIIFELLCRQYVDNPGSMDLDSVVEDMWSELKENGNKSNRSTAFQYIGHILAARMFFLQQFLKMSNECNQFFVPQHWLILQVIPSVIKLTASSGNGEVTDFWLTVSKMFQKNWKCYQKRIPIIFDEAQVALGTYQNVFSFATSFTQNDGRSLYSCFLKTTSYYFIQDITCTIMTGTGMQLEEIKKDTLSSIAKLDVNVRKESFYNVNNTFSTIKEMQGYIDQFLCLSEEEVKIIFKYFQGCCHFIVNFIASACMDDKKYTNNCEALKHWCQFSEDSIIANLYDAVDKL
nr:15266_t:CDS:2 [Entrophospora candida]